MQPFARVTVDNLIAGGARIAWEIQRHFTDPGSYTFQLQVGHTALADADDWIDIGTPVVDTYFTFDTSQRVFGKTLDTHYRVKLTTGVDTYYSDSIACEGLLSKRDWLFAREMFRKEQLRHQTFTSPKGFLLKARRYGPRCTTCTDQYTQEVTNTNCSTCYGTEFQLGYFEPLPAYYADIGMAKSREHRDGSTGTASQNVINARFLGNIQLYSYDVWINEFSDDRYYIHTVSVTSQVRGIPITYDCELRLAPYTDVIYTLDLNKTYPPVVPGLTIIQEDVECQPKPKLIDDNYLEEMLDEIRRKRGR